MPAVAITDHGTMFGVIDFYKAATGEGIKPIIGVEAYMAARTMQDRDSKLDRSSSHLLLLAENETGYKNLLKISSAAQLDGFYYYPRIDHDFLARHSEGIICTSGCMSAEVPRLLLDGKQPEAVKMMNWYYDVFGRDNFFIELQQHNIKEIIDLNKKLLEMGVRYDAKYVATNDVHYINQDDARLQDILLAIIAVEPTGNDDRVVGRHVVSLTPEVEGQLGLEIGLKDTPSRKISCNVRIEFDQVLDILPELRFSRLRALRQENPRAADKGEQEGGWK